LQPQPARGNRWSSSPELTLRERAIDRARLYVAAGADVIFPEASTSRDMFL